MAKLHVRYMVGGHARGLADEKLYRFEFPERPGALLKFLRAIGTQWNVSLFHYRNHGSDHGRVLAGIQVPQETHTDFLLHINELQYAYTEESDNPAYKLFLGRRARRRNRRVRAFVRLSGCWRFARRGRRRFFARTARAARPHRRGREL